jgi:hypothetical protein
MFRVKAWNKFQHFKDRRPPWIKLYRDLLEDMDWHELDGDSAKALIGIWLIASENDGNLPDMKRLAFRLRITEKACLSICMTLSHWLEQVDDESISARYQDDRLETETETETEIQVETEGEAREKIRASQSEIIPPKKPRSEPKGSRWPSEAVVPDDWIQDGARCRANQQMPNIDLRTEALKFANYWASKAGGGATKLDWKKTWLNWCITAKGSANVARFGAKSQLEQLAEVIAGERTGTGIDG